MNRLLRDLRYAVRGLRHSPAFSLTAVFTLALGIGANTVIFGLFYGLFLRPLPYPQPQQLYRLYLTNGGIGHSGPNDRFPWSYPKYETLVDDLDGGFASVAGYADTDLTLTGGSAQRVAGELIAAPYLSTLGVPPLLGRDLVAADDERPSGRAVALLGYDLWQQRFAGERSVVGRDVEIDKQAFEVIGVLPQGFRGLSGQAELWIPLAAAPRVLYPSALDEEWGHWFSVVARSAGDLAPATAVERMRTLGRAVDEAHPSPMPGAAAWGGNAVPLPEADGDASLRRALVLLLAGVGCVLLIACVNLANLLLARASGRRREIAVRRALGAAGGDLVRLALTESVLLSLVGGACGLALAVACKAALAGAGPAFGLPPDALTLAPPILGFAALLSVATGLLFGLAPALHGVGGRLVGALRDGGAGSLGGGRGGAAAARQILVAAQVALAVVLLAAAGLLMKSFLQLRAVDPGYDSAGVLSFSLDPPQLDRAAAPGFKQQLLERLAALPGVESATVDNAGPLSGRRAITVVTNLDGQPIAIGEGGEIGVHQVGPDHFRTLGIDLVAGRPFHDSDRQGAPLVAILSRTAARTLWPGEEAVGRRIAVGVGSFPDGATAEVVAVADDVRYDDVDKPPVMEIYLPFQQGTGGNGTVYVKTAGRPEALIPAVRRAVAEAAPDLPLYDLSTLSALAGRATAGARWSAVLLAVFAAFALLLAAVGLYGVTAFAVSQRRREMGLRLAIGASRGDLVGMFLRRGAVLTAAGLVAGLALALALRRLIAGVLYEVAPGDPLVLAAISLLLALTTLVAMVIPARRAAQVDPARVLRAE